jgi:hypothetical protein
MVNFDRSCRLSLLENRKIHNNNFNNKGVFLAYVLFLKE